MIMTKRNVLHFITPLLLICLLALLATGCDLLAAPPAEQEGVLAPDAPQLPDAPSDTAVVTEVVDGDTINVLLDGRSYRIRYIGIDTPERDEACFDDATQANATYVAGQTVRLVQDVSDTDQFGRLLRYVYVGDVLVNAELVAGGWAESKRYRPDDTLFSYLEELEETAAAEQLGCHPAGVFSR